MVFAGDLIWPRGFSVALGSDYLDAHHGGALSEFPRPGDVILRAPHIPTKAQSAIQNGQIPQLVLTGDRHDEHTCWTHVGIFVDQAMVCDSTPENQLSIRPIVDFIVDAPNCHIRIRRAIKPRGVSGTEWASREAAIPSVADSIRGHPYSKIDAVMSGLANQRGASRQKGEIPEPSHCSNAAALLLLSAFGLTVWQGTDHEFPVPATFSLSPSLSDVKML